MCTLEIPDLPSLERFACLLARHLPVSCVVALNGTLGAGKTRLVQAIAAACDIDRDEVISPTFVLCREYHGQRWLFHVDAYRVRDEQEFLALGAEEWFASPALTLVEWGERVAGCFPTDSIQIEIEVTGESSRRITLTSRSSLHAPYVERIVQEFRQGK
jgi:tRNA threonylcarbamoyladenosine biosynthesis protein TsaE